MSQLKPASPRATRLREVLKWYASKCTACFTDEGCGSNFQSRGLSIRLNVNDCLSLIPILHGPKTPDIIQGGHESRGQTTLQATTRVELQCEWDTPEKTTTGLPKQRVCDYVPSLLQNGSLPSDFRTARSEFAELQSKVPTTTLVTPDLLP